MYVVSFTVIVFSTFCRMRYIVSCAVLYRADLILLQVFEFFGNDDMTYPPYEVQTKGSEGVLRYFKQILGCSETKMMLIDGFDLAEVDNIIFKYPQLTWLDLARNNLIKVRQHVHDLQLSLHFLARTD